MPIEVRRTPAELQGPGSKPFQVVNGHRRHFATTSLGFPIRAIIVDVDDKDLLRRRIAENTGRAGFTAIELGRLCCELRRSGAYASLRALASDIGHDPSQVTQAVKLAELPEEVLGAFGSLADIGYRHAKPLSDAVEADRDGVIQRAQEIKKLTKSLKAAEIVKHLMGKAGQGGVEPSNTGNQIVVASQVVGELKVTRGQIRVVLKVDVDTPDQADVKHAIEQCLTLVSRRGEQHSITGGTGLAVRVDEAVASEPAVVN